MYKSKYGNNIRKNKELCYKRPLNFFSIAFFLYAKGINPHRSGILPTQTKTFA